MSLIKYLKEHVHQVALEQESEYITEKTEALVAFYPFLLCILKARPSLISRLQNHLNPRIEDLLVPHEHLKQDFLQTIAQTAPQHEIERVLNHAIAPTIHVLEDEASSQDPIVIEHYLNQYQSEINHALAPWTMIFLTGLGLSTGNSTAPIPSNIKEKTKKSRCLALISVLILLGFILFLLTMCTQSQASIVLIMSNLIAGVTDMST